MANEPAIRAAITKDFLDTVEAAEPDLMAQITSAVPLTTVGDLTRLTRLGWISMGDHLALNEAAHRVVGDTTFRALWRRSMLRSFDHSTLKPLLDGAVRLFGLSPAGMTKIAPRAWALVSRDCGELVLEPSSRPNEARVVLAHFPPPLFRSRTFIVGLAGAFECFYDLSAVRGEVSITNERPDEGSAVFELRWS
jgi:hypothetical protein